MIKYIITIAGLILVLIIAGCGTTGNVVKEQACSPPYIEYKAGECCLDQNNNSVCDKHEEDEEDAVEEKNETEPVREAEYSVSAAKSAIKEIYGENTIFREGSPKISKEYNSTTLDYVDITDSNYATILEINDKEKVIENEKELRDFIMKYEDSKVINRSIKKDEQGRPKYEYDMQTSLDFVKGTDNRIVDYRYWAKVYELHYGGYVARELVTPIGAAYVYVRCAPDIIFVVYPDDYAGLASMWGSLTEQEYEDMLESSLSTDYNNAVEEAYELLEKCPE